MNMEKTSMQLNGGKIENSGIEFTVAFTPVRKEDWALSISLNSSKNWNKARNQQYEATLNDVLTGSGTKILKKGYPLSGFWSYSFAGLSARMDVRYLIILMCLRKNRMQKLILLLF